jgi:signal transduction histidine kinase
MGEQPFGIGLAISKKIIEAHNGQIWVESNADEGTIFFVKMPLM